MTYQLNGSVDGLLAASQKTAVNHMLRRVPRTDLPGDQQRTLLARAHSISGSGDGGRAGGQYVDGDQEGRDLMSQLMEEVREI